MSEKIMKEQHFTDMANALRERLEVTTTYKPRDIAAAIDLIPVATESILDQYLEGSITTLYDNTVIELNPLVFLAATEEGAEDANEELDTSLKTIHFDAVTTIISNGVNYAGALSHIEKIILPKVETIPSVAFQNFTNLKVIDLTAVKTISASAFNGRHQDDTDDTHLILRGDTVCNFSLSSAFTMFENYKPPYVYVPSSLLDEYKNNEVEAYSDYFRAIEDYPDICN